MFSNENLQNLCSKFDVYDYYYTNKNVFSVKAISEHEPLGKTFVIIYTDHNLPRYEGEIKLWDGRWQYAEPNLVQEYTQITS